MKSISRKPAAVRWIVIFSSCLAALLGMVASTTFAAAPKSVILKFQKKAPEALEVEVLKVELARKITRSRAITQYKVSAKITGITRSKSGVKIGDVITIFYANESAEPGDFPGKVKKESKYKAFLKFDEKLKLYGPAAMSGSFEEVNGKT